jgi:6-pyruvoyltetrahydropterin/6-carboxytetrahydropterin synthase
MLLERPHVAEEPFVREMRKSPFDRLFNGGAGGMNKLADMPKDRFREILGVVDVGVDSRVFFAHRFSSEATRLYSRFPGSERIIAIAGKIDFASPFTSFNLSATMPFQITTTRHFSAAHQLRLYDGSLEPVHGHNWVVKVTVQADRLDAIGVVMDFHELERLVDLLISPMHNRHLNELPTFAQLNPSAENVALFIGRSLQLPAGVSLMGVEVWETPENSAIYRA